jgi:hypothetical protein
LGDARQRHHFCFNRTVAAPPKLARNITTASRRMPRRESIPPVPTLAQLRAGGGSRLWVYCAHNGCDHKAPLPLAPIILYGPQASSNALRRKARCTRCGNLGAVTSHPGTCLGFIGQSWPVNGVAPVHSLRTIPYQASGAG